MPTLEAPIARDWPVPPSGSEDYGQFVVLSHDPVAAIAVLQDEEASRAAAALSRTKYLAVVTSTGFITAVNEDGEQKLTLQFHLIGEGLPDPRDQNFSIPVAPETAHPLDRAPVIPSIPLPWPNFYIHTLESFKTLVSRVHYDALKPYPYVLLDQRGQVLLHSIADRNASTARALAEAYPGVARPNGFAEPRDGASEISLPDTSSDSSEGRGGQADEDIAEIYQKIEKVENVVEVWTDIATVDPHCLGRPDDFFTLKARVEPIVADYERRMLAQILSKPGTGEWVQDLSGVSEMHVGSEPDLVPTGRSVDSKHCPDDARDRKEEEDDSVFNLSRRASQAFAETVPQDHEHAPFPPDLDSLYGPDAAPLNPAPDDPLTGHQERAMITLETPTERDWPVPKGTEDFGQLVVLSFDPVASVACLEDDEATRVAAALPREKYLALAIGSGDAIAFTPENEYQLSIQFFLIGHGLPREDNPALCIAVAPSTAADHPRNRPALEPSSPLPWPGCYLYTICDLYPLVSRIHHDPAVPPRMITLEQRRQVLMCSFPDQREAQRPGPVLVRTADAEQRPADDTESWPIHSESDSESSSDDKPEDEDEAEELRRLVAIQRKVDKVQIQVEMWMDPSLIPDLEPTTLGDPEKLYPLLDRLKEISQDYQNWMLAKVLTKPHTNKWLEAVACAQDSESAADEGEHDQGSEEPTTNDALPPEEVSGTGAPSTSVPADATIFPLPATAPTRSTPPADASGPLLSASTNAPRSPRGTTLSPGPRLARVWRYITRPFSKTRRSHVEEGRV